MEMYLGYAVVDPEGILITSSITLECENDGKVLSTEKMAWVNFLNRRRSLNQSKEFLSEGYKVESITIGWLK